MEKFIITPEYLTDVAKRANLIKRAQAVAKAQTILTEEIQPTLVRIAGCGKYCAELDFRELEDLPFLCLMDLLKEYGFTDIRPTEVKKVIEICWG